MSANPLGRRTVVVATPRRAWVVTTAARGSIGEDLEVHLGGERHTLARRSAVPVRGARPAR